MRQRYWIPWNDETTQHARQALEYLAFEISQHTRFSFSSCKERLYRFVGWMYSISEKGKK